MRQPSNVRCYLPKAEVTELLTVFQQIAQAMQTIAEERRELADKDRPA